MTQVKNRFGKRPYQAQINETCTIGVAQDTHRCRFVVALPA
jgi:hypothetical protein